MQTGPLISVVSPVYGAEKIIDTLVNRIQNALSTITPNYEIILVDDCGPDNSWMEVKKNAERDERIKGIKLSRNFGQHYAITAGLDHVKGEWIVVMDCDLQDQPEEIPRLYRKALEGYDVVLAKRLDRKDSFVKKLFSKLFYASLTYLTGTHQDKTIANFGIYNHKVITAIRSMRESIRYFPTMVRWVGFNRTAIEVEHAPRAEGESSYNFRKLINLALDIILAYSDKPVRLTIKAGLLISAGAFVFALFNIIRYFLGQISVMGYSSLITSIWFLSGLTISILGIIGLYVGKTFEGVKARPIYIIDEIVE